MDAHIENVDSDVRPGQANHQLPVSETGPPELWVERFRPVSGHDNQHLVMLGIFGPCGVGVVLLTGTKTE